ncbi:3-deoxy-D-manno-octulosonic acid kinase [Parasphingorhabdus sp.]|uniref:3-deoxy-D-manno-octulosonic acid kinase n=1 Tax=Parasphingorhabdus sp. TaxID=2709688 RepID=UPI0030A33617
MGPYSELRSSGSVIRYDRSVLDPFEPRLFDVAWIQDQGHHRGNAAGRGAAHFLSFAGHEMVLRPLLRGGLVRKISRDLYLRTQLERTRAIQEFSLLGWMWARDLPVPRPVAAQMCPHGLFYCAALITLRIPNAQPLEDMICQYALDEGQWAKVGGAVRAIHDAGVYHSDLNRRNILIDSSGDVWLIDFDKCERRVPGAWTNENLDRLLRSLRKNDPEGRPLRWSKADWQALLDGYAQGAPAR